METPPDEPPGGDISKNISRGIVYLNRKILNSEREAQINKIKIGKSAAVDAKAQREMDIACLKARKLSGVVTKLYKRLGRLKDLRSNRSDRPPLGSWAPTTAGDLGRSRQVLWPHRGVTARPQPVAAPDRATLWPRSTASRESGTGN